MLDLLVVICVLLDCGARKETAKVNVSAINAAAPHHNENISSVGMVITPEAPVTTLPRYDYSQG